jgi:hypothetical protein
VYQLKTGEGLKIEEYNYPEGLFTAQVRSVKTGEWTEYRVQGDAIKLPLFLKQNDAVKEIQQ